MGLIMKYIFFLIFILVSTNIFADASFFDDSKLDNPKLLKAIESYQGLEFETSKKLFTEIIESTSSRLEKATAIKYMAFIYTLAQDDDNAEKYYAQLLHYYYHQ